jgi:hypothetical protein
MADGWNPYAAGSKIYNGGSSAATSGTVNPMGYIDRSLNQQSSTRRSGLAKAALTRLSASKKAATTSPAASKVSKVQSQAKRTEAAQRQAIAQQQQRNNLLRSGKTGVVINGKSRVLPFDYDLNMRRIQEKRGLDDLLASLNAEESSVNQGFYAQKRYLDDQYRDNLRGVLANNSARGMAFSSSYLNDMTQTNADYNNAGSALSAEKTNALNSITDRRRKGDTGFLELLAALDQENARRASERAAQGGYAALDPGYRKPKATPTPKLSSMLTMPGQKTSKRNSFSTSDKKRMSTLIARKTRQKGKLNPKDEKVLKTLQGRLRRAKVIR